MTDLCRLIFWTLVDLMRAQQHWRPRSGCLGSRSTFCGAPLREGSPLVFLIGWYLLASESVEVLCEQQWRVGNFGRKLPCGKTLRSHDAEIEVGPEPPPV